MPAARVIKGEVSACAAWSASVLPATNRLRMPLIRSRIWRTSVSHWVRSCGSDKIVATIVRTVTPGGLE